MSRSLWKFCLVGLPVAALACTGDIGAGRNGGPGGASNPPGSSDPANPKPPGVDQPPGEGEPPSTISTASKCVTGKPGPRLLRRLTEEQLDNSVRDLFRNANAPRSNIFNDPQVLGFTGDAASLLVRDLGSQQLMTYAEQVARWAMTNVPDISPCKEMTPACRSQFIKTFGLRAFRQPPSDAMVARYEKLFASGATFEQGLEMTITGMLQSPFFLYRREIGEPNPGKPGTVRLTPYEVASSISYLITRSMPDEQLLQAAASNQLSTREQIDAQVDRLLLEPKNRETMHTFVGEWLESKRVAMVLKDPKVFDFTDAMRADMERETAALVEDVIFTRKGSLTDLLKADYRFVNASLAKHYGITGVTGTDFVKVPSVRDAGILANGSILAGNAGTTFSSPTLRGKLVRTRLLCESLPAPPDDVDTMIKVPENAKTTREIFSAHSENAACAGCHLAMDPIGYGFEHYDVVGRYRDKENGVAIDASGVIKGDKDVTFNGLAELSDYLSNNDNVRQCMVRFMSYFAYGAASWNEDACTFDAISAEAKASQWSIRSVLTAITRAPHFTTRVQ